MALHAVTRVLPRAFTLAALAATIAFTLACPAAAFSAPLIVIDPGHGGPYSNANANGLREKNVNLAIGLELRRQLLARGYRVAMTRTTDRAVTYSDLKAWNWNDASQLWSYAADGHRGIYKGIPKDDLQARANVANNLGADVFISIHNNGSASAAARGTETYASPRDPLGRRIGPLVHKRILARTGLRDRGYHSTDYYVCRWTSMPAILVEGAFITNTRDAALLKSATFRARLARGIAEGLDAWFATRPFTATARPVKTRSAAQAAAVASSLRFPNGAETVIVARSDRWADVPGAPALAARLGAPLLWIDRSGPASVTANALARLRPQKLIALGVSGSFDDTLTSLCASASALPTSAVEAIAASSRAELAVSIAESVGPAPSGAVIVADSSDASAILAAASTSAVRRVPVLVAERGALPSSARSLEALSPGRLKFTLLVGSTSALPSTVASGMAGVRRIDGYFSERAATLLGRYFPTSSTSSYSAVVADQRYGAEFLSAAAYAAANGRPLLPVSGRLVSPYTRAWITNRRPQLKGFEVFDARSSIPYALEHTLVKADRE